MYEICPICFWEDDESQLRWPLIGGGANRPSLAEAQMTYAAIGVSEERLREHVRPPMSFERRDPGWRPIDLTIDRFDTPSEALRPWPPARYLYYWRPDYWLRQN